MKVIDSALYEQYCKILQDELKMATGCTEPIAIAYCAAKARSLLDSYPQSVEIFVSGNIIKNVKSVVVPNTGGMKGIKVAAAAGIVAGDSEKMLQVICNVCDEQREKIKEFLEKTPVSVGKLDCKEPLEILVKLYGDNESASVRISGFHTNIVAMEHNGEAIDIPKNTKCGSSAKVDHSCLTITRICEFADILKIEDVKECLDRQIDCNTAIANEGLVGDWGAQIGKILMKRNDSSLRNRAKAMAAAGSDARMSGCELPVVINSGSGNQGLTVSLPVIEYFKASGKPEDMLYRSLVVSNLCSIHAKSKIGELSAYCGAVTAGSAAAAGIAYLMTKDPKVVAHTLVNSLAITSGIICDGAKPSCAAKIAIAVDSGLLGLEMYLNGSEFYGGDGVLSKGIENTLDNIGTLGSKGMKQLDKMILEIMLEE